MKHSMARLDAKYVTREDVYAAGADSMPLQGSCQPNRGSSSQGVDILHPCAAGDFHGIYARLGLRTVYQQPLKGPGFPLRERVGRREQGRCQNENCQGPP